MEAVHSKRFSKELDNRIIEGEPVAVVHNDKVVGCYIPCEETMPLRGFPVLDSLGATRVYQPLGNAVQTDIMKRLRYNVGL